MPAKPARFDRTDEHAQQRLRTFARSLPMTLLKAREAVMNEFRPHLRALGVTEQQWRILRALEALGECSASDLAEATCISMPSLSRILSGLEQRGLVRRHADPSDLRRTFIAIAAPGEKLLREGALESERIYTNIAKRLGSAQIDSLYALLDNVSALDSTSNGKHD
jgi:homoprotocatechuate degradation regulator HpaR